jgi:hypothetical protein
MLVKEHEKYHKMCPKDIRWDGTKVSEIEVARQTEATGEQFCIKIPVFLEDSREILMDRVNFIYSIIQDRMEDENKATVEAARKRGETIRDNVAAKIAEYEAKNQKPPKKLIESLEQAEQNLALLG